MCTSRSPVAFTSYSKASRLGGSSILRMTSTCFVCTPRSCHASTTAWHVFLNMWNNHRLRTAGNKTPLQLFVTGLHARGGSALGREHFETMNENEAMDLGIDSNAPLQIEDDDAVGVEVPPTVSTLSEDQLEYFNQQLEFSADSLQQTIFDDSAYIRGIDILHDFLQV